MPPAFVKESVIGNPNEYRPAIPLDDLLRRVRLSGVIQTSIQLTAPWGCDLPQNADEVLLYLVLVGECVAYTEKKADPIRLSGGDALLVPAPHQHAMADSLTTPLEPLDRFVPAHLRTADSADEFLAKTFRSAVQYGGGGEMTLIATMRLYVEPGIPNVILKNLPTLIPLRGFISSNQSFLKHMLFQISAHGSGGFTGQAIASRLAECVLISALRSYMEQMSKGRSKLYHGWNDPFLSRVVGAIYDAPDFDWSISNMASKAGLSRSAFIHRFSDVIGQTPGEFILSIRMARAMELLEKTDVAIAQIATRVGYASEASFSRAFLRWAGVTPGFARRRKPMDAIGTHRGDALGPKQTAVRKREDAR